MFDELKKIREESSKYINEVTTTDALEELKIKYLGRKGILTGLLRNINNLEPKDRGAFGKEANILKNDISELIDQKNDVLKKAEKSAQLSKEKFDISLPGRKPKKGSMHPISMVMEEIKDIFCKMGFEIADGPEIETNEYNFDFLNFPPDHPAKDMQDTIYINKDLLLRTHTSPVQVRVFENTKPPVKIIAPGRVYRHDSDMSHSPMFHQVEGFLVDEDITFADLKWILNSFACKMFGDDVRLRFRPSFFPFTEPSAEIDISCFICGGKGCRTCGTTGWIEILGAGMIDPNVFKSVKYDTEKYTGFAFGMGVERIAILKYAIDDIRLFFENDIRFLSQFS